MNLKAFIDQLIILSFLRNLLPVELFRKLSGLFHISLFRLQLCRVDMSLVLHKLLIIRPLLLGNFLITSALRLIKDFEL